MANLSKTQYSGAAHYKFRKILGEGAVGEVWEVVHKQTQELFAIKRVSKQQAKLVSYSRFFESF